MPAQPRLILSQSFYHVMTRGNNRQTIFRCEDDFRYYLDLIARFKEEYPFNLYHYCLIPNHTHFMIQTKLGKDFSTFMKKLNLAYYQHYKNSYGWVGHLWQGRFKSQPVGKDNYLIQCGKYIELNPVRAGIVSSPQEYEFSSNKYYSEGLPNTIITENIFYSELGRNEKERQSKYQELIIEDLVADTYSKKIWGSGIQRYNEQRKIFKNIN